MVTDYAIPVKFRSCSHSIEQYPTEEFLNAVKEIDNATTAEVADLVGCSYDLAYRRLNELSEDERITGMKVGSTFIWNLM